MSESSSTATVSEDPSSRLIAALEAEADLVDHGEFSLDVAEAGAKLSAFALANPAAWTLLLVEVGSLLGASRVEFELEPDHSRVSFEGVTLTSAELGRLTVWSDDDDDPDPTVDVRRRLACRQLALAYGVLRTRAIEQIEILVEHPDAPGLRAITVGDRLSVEPSPVGEATRVRFTVRFGSSDPARAESERELLGERCRCSTVPVYLGDVRVAKGWARVFGNPTLHSADQAARAIEVPIELDGRTLGIAGYHLGEVDGAFVSVLVNGVQIEDIHGLGKPGFRAVVEAELARDLAGGKLLRDERLTAVLAAVEAARIRLEAIPVREPAPELGADATRDGIRAMLITLLVVGFLALYGLLALLR